MTGPVPAAAAPGGPVPAIIAESTEADVIAAAARGCPAVDGLCAGAWGGVATYLPGREVPGVRVAGDHLVISVRARWGVPAAEVARQVRAAVAALAGSRRIDVVVADVADHDAADRDAADREVASAPWPAVSAGGPGERKLA
jgi:hypothetical protein